MKHPRLGFFIFVSICLFLEAGAARAENWPQWRGPRTDGTSAEKDLPTEWGVDKNVRWKIEIPGDSHASPILWEKSVFVTTALGDGHERALLRLDAETGKVLWQKVAVKSDDLENKHTENSHASSTPATDGKHVFTSFYASGKATLQSFDFDGNVAWAIEPIKFKAPHGYSSSPVLSGDLLIVNFNQFEEPCLLAFEKETGKVRWRIDYTGKSGSYVTPLEVESAGRKQLLLCGSGTTEARDPATGASIWTCKGPTAYCVSNIIFGNDIAYANGGSPIRAAIAVKTTGQGDVSDTGIIWKTQKAVTYVPSPLYYQDHFYSVVDNGVAACFETATGKIVWQERIGGDFRGSPVVSDGKIFATDLKGITTVFEANPEKFVKIATNTLDESVYYASPAVSEGRIYIRSANQLYCIAKP